jgi:hypothetical protein
MSPAWPGTKNDCAGEGQQQFTQDRNPYGGSVHRTDKHKQKGLRAQVEFEPTIQWIM